MPDKLSEPLKELPQRSSKVAAECTELHLASRGITKLTGFEKFINLKGLWLNNNKLTDLDNLECGFGLHYLYCHNNNIKSISDSLGSFPFIKILTLDHNSLNNIGEVIEELRQLRHLESIDLSNNPITGEDNYRLRILAEIPWLKTLDRQQVTEKERKAAERFRKLETRAHVIKPKKRLTSQEIEEIQTQERRLQEILNIIRAPLIRRRIFLQPLFHEYDPRRLGYVPEHQFQSILKRLAIDLSDDEIDLLLRKYNVPTKITAITKTGNLIKQLFHYRKFCQDAVPRDLRLRDETQSDPTTTVPEISATASDLSRFVKSIKRQQQILQDTMTRTSIFMSSEDSLTPSQNYNFKFHDDDNPKRAYLPEYLARTGLSAWEYCELGRLVRELQLKSEGRDQVSQNDVEELLQAFSGLGKTPEVGEEGARRLLYGENYHMSSPEERNVPINRVMAVLGYVQNDNKGKASSEPSRGSKGGRKTSLANLNADTQKRLHDDEVTVVRWRNMLAHEAQFVESLVGTRARELYDQLIRTQVQPTTGSTVTDHQRSLSNLTMRSALTANHLREMYATKAVTKPVMTPQEIIRHAPKRVDTLILPNLSRSQPVFISPDTVASSYTAPASAGNPSTSQDLGGVLRDWTQTFASLGIHGNQLTASLDRKQRSLTATIYKSSQSGEGNSRSGLPPKEVLAKRRGGKSGWDPNTTSTMILNIP